VVFRLSYAIVSAATFLCCCFALIKSIDTITRLFFPHVDHVQITLSLCLRLAIQPHWDSCCEALSNLPNAFLPLVITLVVFVIIVVGMFAFMRLLIANRSAQSIHGP